MRFFRMAGLSRGCIGACAQWPALLIVALALPGICQAAGLFDLPVGYGTGAAPWCVGMADLNGDNHLDLAVANNESDGISILRLRKGILRSYSRVDLRNGVNRAQDSTADGCPPGSDQVAYSFQ